jgi:hypothetical protein
MEMIDWIIGGILFKDVRITPLINRGALVEL